MSLLDSQATKILNAITIFGLNTGKSVKFDNAQVNDVINAYLSILITNNIDKIEINLSGEDEFLDSAEELHKISKYVFSNEFKELVSNLEKEKVSEILYSVLSGKPSNIVKKYNKKIHYKSQDVKGHSQNISLFNIKNLINKDLAEHIAGNMGSGFNTNILNYRTGRFASTAYVSRVIMSRDGALGIFYTYMKYPYQTFEPGFKQGHIHSRDPKLLISKSIREIANTLVKNKLRITRE